MGAVQEPDKARSVVVAKEDLAKARELFESNRFLAIWRDSLYLPDSPEADVEIVRGLGPTHASFFEHELRKVGVHATACVWNEVAEGVDRAPERLPGMVGDEDRYQVVCGRVVTGCVVLGGREPQDTWQWQSGCNHQHPCLENVERLDGELKAVEGWIADLNALFPDRHFIVARYPGEEITFYEPDGDAPTESEGDWQLMYARGDQELERLFRERHAAGWRGHRFEDYAHPVCSCGCAETTGEEEVLHEHGVILAICRQCGVKHFVANRLLCYAAGRRR